jgi:hypothetical protein
VKVTGISVALLDMPSEYTQEFNRWYDLDHLPEHVSKDDVLMARRYVATPETATLPGIQASDLTAGHPPYAAIYFFGGPLDFMSDEASAGWREMDRRIIKAGRFWTQGRVAFASWWKLTAAAARPSIHISNDAIPHLPHQSIVLILGKASSPEHRPDAVAWWEGTQLPDLHEIPGVLATLRFEPAQADESELLLHVLLCSSPVNEIMRDFVQVRRYQELTGRYPAHSRAYETVAILPYDLIIPLRYDFVMSDSTE